MEIMKQIAKAKERVDFAIFTFAESSGIDDQLALAHSSGIAVRGALYKSQANQKWSAKETLAKVGLELHLVPRASLPKPRPHKLHHKLMVIDGRLIIAGSFNYSGQANKLNDENMVVLRDLDSSDSESIAREKRLESNAMAEIDHLIDAYGEQFVE